jgi:outer membrane biogenesis lipoprotein LolB
MKGRLFFLLVASILLQACGTSSTETEAQCGAWRPLTYSGKLDTAPTIEGVRTHNKTGKNLGCWD